MRTTTWPQSKREISEDPTPNMLRENGYVCRKDGTNVEHLSELNLSKIGGIRRFLNCRRVDDETLNCGML